jgi:hypothetical protein
VVIESDDWGTIRMQNSESIRKLKNKGIAIDKNPYSQLDTLETFEDIMALFEVLEKYKKTERQSSPVFTLNFIMANPDFEKINYSGYNEYFFESMSDTYFKRDGNQNVLNIIKEGIYKGLIKPQFHGREHVNVNLWLKLLSNGNEEYLHAFKEKCFGIEGKIPNKSIKNLMATYEYDDSTEKSFIVQSIDEGLKMFENIFGFNSQSTVAPQCVWSNELESVFSKNGIKYIQTNFNQRISNVDPPKYNYHYTGKRNNKGQFYIVRNAFFEPSYNDSINWIKNTIQKAKIAFTLNIPLIICTHRINFVGGISESNRTNNLRRLSTLFDELYQTFPDLEFLTSDELGKTIESHVRN